MILVFFCFVFGDYSVVLLYWKLERSVFFMVKDRLFLKLKLNDEYYQKSDYRLLRINTFFLMCSYAIAKAEGNL